MTVPFRPDRTGFTWNANAQRYRDARGRFVTTQQVRAALDATIRGYHADARALSEQLRAGTLSLRAFDQAMRQLVKDTHLMSSASAVGGWQQFRRNPRAKGLAGANIKRQYRYLNGMIRDLANGTQTLGGSLTNRAVMYVEAGRNTHEDQRLAIEKAQGFDQERSIRHVSDSCDGCIREAKRGWVGIGELVPIGERTCLTRCRCTIERRRSERARRPTPAPRIRRRAPALV